MEQGLKQKRSIQSQRKYNIGVLGFLIRSFSLALFLWFTITYPKRTTVWVFFLLTEQMRISIKMKVSCLYFVDSNLVFLDYFCIDSVHPLLFILLVVVGYFYANHITSSGKSFFCKKRSINFLFVSWLCCMWSIIPPVVFIPEVGLFEDWCV